MKISVKIYSTLRLELGVGEVLIETPQPEPIRSVLQRIAERLGKQEFLSKLLDGERIRKGTMLLIDGRNVLHLQGLDTPVPDAAVLSIFPPGGGG